METAPGKQLIATLKEAEANAVLTSYAEGTHVERYLLGLEVKYGSLGVS